MAEYSELSSIIGKMKRAAIDCWMADQEFYPVSGNEGTYCKWGWAPYQYFRPDENGNGGGKSVGYGDGVTCEAAFDDIRAAVDSVVADWKSLPDGSKCSGPQRQVTTAGAQLGTDAIGSSVQNGGQIATSNDTINQVVLTTMEGSFRVPFLMKYYTKFSSIQSGLGQACVILQANYAAESAIWPAARTDAATILDTARAAWEKCAADKSAANTTYNLSVAAAVATAVAAIITAPVGGVGVAVGGLASVSAGISVSLAGAQHDVAVSMPGSSYAEILNELKTALTKLSTKIAEQEKILISAMTEAENTMRLDLGGYNLDAVSLGDYRVHEATMRLSQDNAAIVSGNMTRVEESLTRAVTGIGSAPEANPTPRPSGIGASASGTHHSAQGLHALTARCLSLTAAEYANGHKLFDATVADFFTTDAAAKDSVNTLLASEALTTNLGV